MSEQPVDEQPMVEQPMVEQPMVEARPVRIREERAPRPGRAGRRGRRWLPRGLEPSQPEFDPPNAPGIYPWLLLLGAPAWSIAHGEAKPVWLAVGGLIVFGAAWVVVVRHAFQPRASDRRRVAYPALGVAMILAVTLMARFGGGWAVLPPTAAIAIGVTVIGPQIVFVGAPFTIATALAAVANGADTVATVTLTWGTFTSGVIPWIIRRLFAAIEELRHTREQLAAAAVAQERTRFSRDMHDLLGHTLSVMVVKAEAVRRLLPARPDAAAAQASDIEALGRQALVEVRDAVTGYRGRGLRAELDAARAALPDAGINPVVRVRVGALASGGSPPDAESPSETELPPGTALAPETDALLGWAVREGVTNVIRHSGATTCRIEVTAADGEAVLEVSDNGGITGGASGDDARRSPDRTLDSTAAASAGTARAGAASRTGRARPLGGTPGVGLLGLRERVEAQGGRLDAGPAPGGGFRLLVRAPNVVTASGRRDGGGHDDASARDPDQSRAEPSRRADQ